MSTTRKTTQRFLYLVVVALGASLGCTTPVPHTPAVRFPDGVDGYSCYRREKTSSGFVYAKASPDYRGSYDSLTMGWAMHTGEYRPEVRLYWTLGPNANSPPGWMSVNLALPGALPPLHTKIYLRLSSGEVLEREFIDPKNWREWKHHEQRGAGFGGMIHSAEPSVKEAFSNAAWADVEIVDPAGTTLSHTRLDLSQIQEDLAVMRRLGEEVAANSSDYKQRCAPFHYEIN
jgi:hypothetical protein